MRILSVPNKYISSLESYCDNNNIQYTVYDSDDERIDYQFNKDDDFEQAHKWVLRLVELDQ